MFLRPNISIINTLLKVKSNSLFKYYNDSINNTIKINFMFHIEYFFFFFHKIFKKIEILFYFNSFYYVLYIYYSLL